MQLKTSFNVICLIACQFMLTAASLTKPYTLRVLNLIPFTGEEPAKGEACQLSSQIVADAINQRGDFLPLYHIEMDYKDEFVGRFSAMQVVHFFEQIIDDPTISRSPVVIGPQYSTGCKAMGPLLPHLNAVALSTWCTAPFLEDHSRYPNLYLNQGTGIARAYAVLRFIQQIGLWNRFGVITNAENINDYGTALFLQDTAYRHGFSVPWFGMVGGDNVDEATMVSLKQSGVRILVIGTCLDVLTVSILCEAYHHGMTGKRYVFISDVDTNLDPNNLDDVIYPGCTRKIVSEQLMQTFFIGGTVLPKNEDREKKSHLGYTWPQFEGMLEDLTNSTLPADDLSRYLCHDVSLKALMALDETEKKLNRMNLTLRDFETKPKVVMKVANESVLRINVAGLRTTGNMSYSSSGKVASDLEVVRHWTPGNGTTAIAAVNELAENGTDVDLESFECQLIADSVDKQLIDWIPPNDQPILKKNLRKIPTEVFIVTLALSGISVIFEVCCIAITLRKAKSNAATFPVSKILGYFGCLIVEIASAMFTVPNITAVIDTLRISLLVCGSALSHSVLAVRAFSILKSSQNLNLLPVRIQLGRTNLATFQTRNDSRRSRFSSTTSGHVMSEKQEIPNRFWPKFDRMTAQSSSLFFAANVIVLACFLGLSEAIHCGDEKRGDGVYLKESDIVVETWWRNCNLPDRLSHYVLAIVALHMVLLLIGMICSYKLGQLLVVVRELVLIRAGSINQFFLCLLALAVVEIIQNPVSQSITIAYSGLLSSVITTLTWVAPVIAYKEGNDIISPGNLPIGNSCCA